MNGRASSFEKAPPRIKVAGGNVRRSIGETAPPGSCDGARVVSVQIPGEQGWISFSAFALAAHDDDKCHGWKDLL
ncbi:hypothetical protein D3C80_1998150 [compost metagenome]